MFSVHNARAATRRGVTAIAVAAGLALGVTALVPTAGADSVGDKRAEANKIADQLDALQARQQDLAAQGEAVRFEQEKAEQAVKDAQTLLDQTNADLDLKRGKLREAAVGAYLTGNDSPELDAFLTSDATSGVQKRTLIEARTSSMRDTIDALGSAQQKAADDKARLDDAQKAAEAKSAQYSSLEAANNKAVADATALNAKVQGELATLVQAEQQRRAEEQARIAQQQTAAANARAAATPAPAATQAGARTGNGGGGNGGGGGGGGGSSVVVPSNPNPPPVGSGASGAVQAAMSKVGSRPYVWGAAGPNQFDCSGLVAWAYDQVGISLPHYSGAQYNATTRISRSQLQAGDLVFWGPGGSEHVAIYTGGGLVHSFGSGNGVNTTALEGWWKPPTGYGRVRG
jgi:cell wall-associated NlpC family hydrolase